MTDRRASTRPLEETVRAALDGGCRWVWLRDRDLPSDERRALGETVLATVRAAGGILCVGGDPGLAAALGADGVHLTGDGPPAAIAAARGLLGGDAWIGVSAHSPAEVERAAQAGADYVTLSPIFPTPSKPGYGPALGLAALRAAARLAIPVVALGGITPDSTAACRAAGAAGVAILGGLMRAADPAAEARRYRDAWGGRDASSFAAAGP